MNYFVNVEVEINHHCNMSCSYCPNSVEERANKGVMSMEQFSQILSQLADINYKGKVSYHFYNEPLLHPNLEGIVKRTKEILPEVLIEIYSNGVFLNQEKFDNLIALGVDRFTITKHEGIKKIPFEEVYQNLTSDLLKKVNFKNYKDLIYTNRGGMVEAGKNGTDNILKRPCMIPISTLVITIDGSVLPCYEDFRQTNVMGNVFKEHIKEIWNSEKYVSFRNELKKGNRNSNPLCSKCNNRMMF